MNPFQVFPLACIVFFLSCIAIYAKAYARNTWYRYVKGLPLICLILHLGFAIYMKDEHSYYSDRISIGYSVFWGLIASLMGDILLTVHKPNYPLYGGVAFIVAHV